MYKASLPDSNKRIILYTREGCGIRCISRIMGISTTTVIARTKRIAAGLQAGPIAQGHSFEVDELSTYVRHKDNRIWVAYAKDRQSNVVVALCVGKRSKRTLQPIMTKLVFAQAKQVRKDALPLYRSIVPESFHHVKRAGTNGIERMNLTLRTHLKRLNRRTLCYSKSAAMLLACVQIYCWG